MAERVEIAPGGGAYEQLKDLLADGAPIVLEFERARTVPVFEHGDNVQVPFDDGWGPAVVDSYDGRYVKVRYGPCGRPNDLKFRTSLSPDSVRTSNVREFAATVRVVAP
jgi:hypothetical protein